MFGIKRKYWIAATAGVAVFLVSLGPALWTAFFRYRDSNPINRGRQVASRMGCFACHGPGGMDGAMNPKTGNQTVPAWGGGNYMMYVKNKGEIREYILDGFPGRKRKNPVLWAKYQAAGIHMPSFRDTLSGNDLEDLLAYVEAVFAMDPIEDPLVAEGRRLALKWDCFHCHGVNGSGGPPNPGSFAGFIPGWLGPAYQDMVQSDQELEEWIRKGKSRRIEENPIAGIFLSRQKAKMPAFESELSDGKIRGIIAYISWLRGKYAAKAP